MTELLKQSAADPALPLILLVDDDADTRDLFALFFADSGFSVEQASNGADALTKIRTRLPDIVLSDLWMPVMDGFALCRAIKRDDRTAHVPVVAVSCNTSVQYVTETQAAGFDKVLPKPSDLDHLLAEIRNALLTTARLCESGRTLQTQAASLCSESREVRVALSEARRRSAQRRSEPDGSRTPPSEQFAASGRSSSR